MPCYRPLDAWRSRDVNPSGKRGIVFDKSKGYEDLSLKIACGQCVGCRLERSRQWAIRCVHEATLHEDNCFITLTYNNDNLPADGSLDLDHFQRFMKRFRKKIHPLKIRFFHCGEYGDKFKRPHYHAIIFGFDFPDKKLHQVRNGYRLYTSDVLSKLWPYGFSSIGSVTFESAAYVARYVMKKITGENAIFHYSDLNVETGELENIRKPEYVTMSRRPGIGAGWFEKFGREVYPDDFIIINGKKVKPPKFYDSQFEVLDEKEFKRVKAERVKTQAIKNDNSADRLAVKEKIKTLQIERLIRDLE